MASAYMGKILRVDLSEKRITEESVPDRIYRRFLGGYGIGIRFLYQWMKPGTDPLGPDNIIGFLTGFLTGTGAISSGRFTVVAKSPLTGTWGDSNCGGKFGPQLKRAGYDGVFITGKSDRPVYVFLDDGKAEIRDAGDLWGKDSCETEKILKAALGNKVEVACIGQSGEKLSLISCVMTDRGRAAGRSGLGAVMGSKNLKAVVVWGKQKVQVANRDELNRLNKTIKEAVDRRPGPLTKMMAKVMMPMLPFLARRKVTFPSPPEIVADIFGTYGTCGVTASAAALQDSPIKNWKGTQKDYPMSLAARVSDEAVIRYEKKKYGCSGCPVKCGGIIEQNSGPYALSEESHKPEYETISAFGSLCLNDNLEAIILANDICNRYGLDTISAGATIAFAIECFEEGIISEQDTGVALKWGDAEGIVSLLKLLAEREGFGDLLADGVKAAASQIAKGSDEYAMHVGGQELPMHDPRLNPGYGATYVVDPTPARHTAGTAALAEMGAQMEMVSLPKLDKHDYSRKGEANMPCVNVNSVITCAGLCQFPTYMMKRYPLVELVNAATGWDTDLDDLLKTGERIQMLRYCFNLREGFKPDDFRLPARVRGNPSMTYGPLKNITLDEDAMAKSCLRQMGVDEVTGEPHPNKLEELDLANLIQ